jgi:hypothetical protein
MPEKSGDLSKDLGGDLVEEPAMGVKEASETGPRRRPSPVLTPAAGPLDLSGGEGGPMLLPAAGSSPWQRGRGRVGDP